MMKIKRELLKLGILFIFLMGHLVYSFAGEEKCFVIADRVILKISMHKIDDEQYQWNGKAVVTGFDFLDGKKKQIGFLCFSFNQQTCDGEINSLWIEEPFRRCGYGAMLIKSVYNELEALDIKLIHLKVRATNIVAINLYFKLGFVFEDEENNKKFREHFYGFVKMVKRLGGE